MRGESPGIVKCTGAVNMSIKKKSPGREIQLKTKAPKAPKIIEGAKATIKMDGKVIGFVDPNTIKFSKDLGPIEKAAMELVKSGEKSGPISIQMTLKNAGRCLRVPIEEKKESPKVGKSLAETFRKLSKKALKK